MSVFDVKIDGAPQFVSYFAAVHRALRKLEGKGTPQQVYDFIKDNYGLDDTARSQVNKNGRPTFENRAAWARFYLTKAGWMFSPRRGLWALTEQGMQVDAISDEEAVAIYKSVAAQHKGLEDDAEAPGDLFQPDKTQYWFVGAMWGDAVGDQTDRFLKNGIWQNGYMDKFTDRVLSMKPGDRIAIKTTFSQKYDLPFDNRGHVVSVMRIKAVGTITRNHQDGRTVDVDWVVLPEGNDWYFYTYRKTVTRARVEDDDLARRLVAFAFDGAKQDYAFFLAQPYWRAKFADTDDAALGVNADEDEVLDDIEEAPADDVYGVKDIVMDGCFIPESELQDILLRWKEKKNLILQGPPGTGKTWLAKRLAKALAGQRTLSDERLRVVQFHPALSYEDFVRGYRPGGDGRLDLTDGVFLQVVQSALAKPEVEHVLVIEEINRGNPAQVLGEMLTLLECSKRSRAEAMELAYSRYRGEKVFVPDNLYVIGTMNLADRSLALVDLALRRRFAFANLSPCLSDAWKRWCLAKGLDQMTVDLIEQRMATLNRTIADDRTLGAHFQIGHSYVTPHEPISNPRTWFGDVVKSEIGPLLHEYWFDAPEKAEDAVRNLLQG